MAEQIDDMPDSTRGRPPTYPWHEWMDGTARRIIQGEDFDVPPASMAAMIRQRSTPELSATTRLFADLGDDEARGVEFQFHRRTP